jgi:hypothetical protein
VPESSPYEAVIPIAKLLSTEQIPTELIQALAETFKLINSVRNEEELPPQ